MSTARAANAKCTQNEAEPENLFARVSVEGVGQKIPGQVTCFPSLAGLKLYLPCRLNQKIHHFKMESMDTNDSNDDAFFGKIVQMSSKHSLASRNAIIVSQERDMLRKRNLKGYFLPVKR